MRLEDCKRSQSKCALVEDTLALESATPCWSAWRVLLESEKYGQTLLGQHGLRITRIIGTSQKTE